MLYVLREVHELMWILKGLKTHLPLGIDERLKTVVGGRDFAALDSDSSSRNVQFELRIASYFCQSDCHVDLTTETDVVALTRNHAFFVECKRVITGSQILKRLSEARHQLRSRMPKKGGNRLIYGCIAADVTKVAFPRNGPTWAWTNEHSRDVIQQKLIRVAEECQKKDLFKDCRNLVGYWFQIHIPSLVVHPHENTTRFSSYHIFRPVGPGKQRKSIKVFQSMFESVSKEDPRATPPTRLAPRKEIVIPHGSYFSFDESLFHELFMSGVSVPRKMDDEIATLTINEQEHRFSFLELECILPNLTM